jgi:hypothetical protein
MGNLANTNTDGNGGNSDAPVPHQWLASHLGPSLVEEVEVLDHSRIMQGILRVRILSTRAVLDARTADLYPTRTSAVAAVDRRKANFQLKVAQSTLELLGYDVRIVLRKRPWGHIVSEEGVV